MSPACIYKTLQSLMRLLPDGASDAAWELFEEAFKVFITESPHAVNCSSKEQRNSWGSSFGCVPSPPFRSHPGREGTSWGASPTSALTLSQAGLRKECSLNQSLDPKMITDVSSNCAKPMLFPAPVSVGSALLTPKAAPCSGSSELSALLWAGLLLCTAGGSFEAYLKAWSRWTNGVWLFPNTWWNPALDFSCCSVTKKNPAHTHKKRNKQKKQCTF